jgi:hypothetical protein
VKGNFFNILIFFVGLVGTITIGNSLYADLMQVFYGEQGSYWTHKDQPLSLKETGDDFQVLIGGEPLQEHLDGKTFFAADGELVPYPVVTTDVTVRVNNWPDVKARILTKTTFTGFAFGVNVTLMLVGLVQTCLQRKKKAGNHPRA